MKVPFTGEQYESVQQAMVSLMEQLDGHKYHEVLYPQWTDADPPLTKEQLEGLSKALSSRKLVKSQFLL